MTAHICNVVTMENTKLAVTFRSVDGNRQKKYIFGKLLVRTFKLNTKFETLPTSARFITIKLYQKYDIIVTSYEFIRIEFSQQLFTISHATNVPNFRLLVL